jgi:endonuclease-3
LATKKSKPTPASKNRRPAPVDQTIKLLEKNYPDAHCALFHRNAFELLVATILSAQCTDERVNMVTPDLFERYPTPETLAEAPLEDIEFAIRSINFFRNKAKNLKAAAQTLVATHKSIVPQTMEELVALPGVGRKTANVVLGNAFNIPTGVVVDTHVARLSQRLGWSKFKDPKKIEIDLQKLVPEQKWIEISHLLIFHGRQICKARRPLCESCFLFDQCPKIGVKL